MNEQEDRQRPPVPDPDAVKKSAIILGAVLIAVGVWATLARFGVIPTAFDEAWRFVRAAGWGLALVALGVAVIFWSRNPSELRMPARGTRLYRSRTDRWVGGVLGGFGEYFGVDPTVLRLAFIALTIAGWGALVVAYIVMMFVMPEAPREVPGQ